MILQFRMENIVGKVVLKDNKAKFSNVISLNYVGFDQKIRKLSLFPRKIHNKILPSSMELIGLILYESNKQRDCRAFTKFILSSSGGIWKYNKDINLVAIIDSLVPCSSALIQSNHVCIL